MIRLFLAHRRSNQKVELGRSLFVAVVEDVAAAT
jgi:hypothetical protein